MKEQSGTKGNTNTSQEELQGKMKEILSTLLVTVGEK